MGGSHFSGIFIFHAPTVEEENRRCPKVGMRPAPVALRITQLVAVCGVLFGGSMHRGASWAPVPSV